MSVLLSMVYLGVMLLIIFTPIWFVGSLISLFFSQAQRDKIKAHWLIYSVLVIITFLVLSVAWISFVPRHFYYARATEPSVRVPVTRDTIAQADAIIEGSFDTGHVVSTSGENLTDNYPPGFDVNCFVVPFKVEGLAKGDLGKTVDVKIFFTTRRGSARDWGMPLKEKLLLLLKKVPQQADTFELMSQQTSWLVIAHPHPADSSAVDVEKFVLDDAKGFLAECVKHPELPGKILYFTDVPNFFGYEIAGFPQSDPAREHALRIGRVLANGDPELVALASKFEGEYGEVGEIASSICANSGDTSYLQSRLKEYNDEPPRADTPANKYPIGVEDTHFNFPWQVANAIRDSDDVGKMMPIILSAPRGCACQLVIHLSAKPHFVV
jgi:hypothetical protein